MMIRQIPAHQEDLFDSLKPQELRRRIRTIDIEIKEALKKNAYDRAKSLTEEQERLIQELVQLGDREAEDSGA